MDDYDRDLLARTRRSGDATVVWAVRMIDNAQAEIARLRAENERLRAALKPFADIADRECLGFGRVETMPSFARPAIDVDPDDVRRAVAAMEGTDAI